MIKFINIAGRIASMARIAGILSVAVSTFIACKSPSTSKVKTLDAVASGGITKLFQCSGNNPARISADRIIFDAGSEISKRDESDKSVLRHAVMDYFTALQPAMQDMLLNLGGSVLITDDAHIGDYCQAARIQSRGGVTASDSLHGCFVFADDPSGQKPSVFTIVHSGSPETIRYYGPQIFGYLYAQFYSRLGPPTRDGASFSIQSTESMQFVSYKESIADAFMQDMLASRKFNLDNLGPVLGLNAATELRGFAGRSRLLDALSMRKAGDAADVAVFEKERRRAQVRDFFFAHAFQSMNCNAEALEVTRREFPRSLEAYNQINGALITISLQLAGAQSQSATIKSTTSKSATLKSGNIDLMMLMAILPMLNQAQGFNPRVGYQPQYHPQFQAQGSPGDFPMFAGLFSNLGKSFENGGQSSPCSGGSCCGGCCSTCADGTCGSSCACCGVDT